MLKAVYTSFFAWQTSFRVKKILSASCKYNKLKHSFRLKPSPHFKRYMEHWLVSTPT